MIKESELDPGYFANDEYLGYGTKYDRLEFDSKNRLKMRLLFLTWVGTAWWNGKGVKPTNLQQTLEGRPVDYVRNFSNDTTYVRRLDGDFEEWKKRMAVTLKNKKNEDSSDDIENIKLSDYFILK